MSSSVILWVVLWGYPQYFSLGFLLWMVLWGCPQGWSFWGLSFCGCSLGLYPGLFLRFSPLGCLHWYPLGLSSGVLLVFISELSSVIVLWSCSLVMSSRLSSGAVLWVVLRICSLRLSSGVVFWDCPQELFSKVVLWVIL